MRPRHLVLAHGPCGRAWPGARCWRAAHTSAHGLSGHVQPWLMHGPAPHGHSLACTSWPRVRGCAWADCCGPWRYTRGRFPLVSCSSMDRKLVSWAFHMVHRKIYGSDVRSDGSGVRTVLIGWPGVNLSLIRIGNSVLDAI